MYLPASRSLIVLAALALASVVACEGGTRPVVIDNAGGSGGEDGTGGTGPVQSWTFRTLDGADDTGYQPELRLSPEGRLAAVWYRPTDREGVCELADREPAPTDIWEIVYGIESGDDFTVEVVAEVELVGLPTGLSLAFDSGGAPLVAFMGGEPAEFRCGATDSVLARRTPGGWTQQVIDSDGDVPAMVFEEDVDHCANYQNACNLGDVVGLWPALGIAAGEPVLAYRDIHYGFGVDAEEKSDLQLWWRGQRITAEAVSGAGSFNRLAVDDADGIHIAHFNPWHRISDITQDYTDGIWMIHYEGGAWSRERVVPVLQIGEGIGLASSGDRLGLAWFEPKEGRVRYVERAETSWGKPEVVDNRGRTGLAPSLAFDGEGRPAISYRTCGPAGKQGDDCLAADDRLRLARKVGGVWRTTTVRNEAGRQEGLYTSLAFDAGGRAAIAFQESFFDPIDEVVRRRLVLAREEATP